jgi:hypothetical protein
MSRRVDSVPQPYANATDLLDFLEACEPDQYVFRGQTRAYEGPVLPSGLRDRFTAFDASTAHSRWAGISTFKSKIDEEAKARRRAISTETSTVDFVDDGKTTWDLPEAAYQKGFREFFDQPHCQRIKDVGNVLRESAILGIGELIGNGLADLLCQQYGFTSTALDVTTDPAVALFFATHKAPFYTSVGDSEHMGVVYRWRRQRAMIAQDLLLPLEDSNVHSLVSSFSNFIRESIDLNVVLDTLWDPSATTGSGKRLLWILSEGERRSLDALRFPLGTFDRSRIGWQRAALLWPDYEVVRPVVRGSDDSDRGALIGDLLKTHQGESFYFRHVADVGLPDRLTKFVLWPSIRPLTDGPTVNSRLELQIDRIEFEDLYFEMMLRFFSSCSPCQIVVDELIEPGNRQSLQGLGVAHGVVDLGYLLQPSDARLIAERLRESEIYTPIPTRRYIPEEHLESFATNFADAVRN